MSTDFLRDHAIIDINSELEGLMEDLSDDFQTSLEYQNIEVDDLTGMVRGAKQEYSIEYQGEELSVTMHVYDTAADDVLTRHDQINVDDYRRALRERNPSGNTRILYVSPEEQPEKPGEAELLDEFNEELEFLSMSDGKQSLGSDYMHVFNLD